MFLEYLFYTSFVAFTLVKFHALFKICLMTPLKNYKLCYTPPNYYENHKSFRKIDWLELLRNVYSFELS